MLPPRGRSVSWKLVGGGGTIGVGSLFTGDGGARLFVERVRCPRRLTPLQELRVSVVQLCFNLADLTGRGKIGSDI